MKNLAVVATFLFSLVSLGMVLEVSEDLQPPRVSLSLDAAKPKPAADAGVKKQPATRGRPGEDDSDEEEEEDLRPPTNTAPLRGLQLRGVP